MENSFFDKILNFFKPKYNDKTDNENINPYNKNNSKIKLDNSYIGSKQQILELIINYLIPLSEKSHNFDVLELYIYNCDNNLAVLNILQDDTFENDLRYKLKNANIDLGYKCKWQVITDQSPPEKANQIAPCLSLNIVYESNRINKTAQITALEGRLTQDKVILNSDKYIYNIGRGAKPKLDNGTYHTNDIIIEDNSTNDNSDDALKKNRYVSRAHALIAIKDGFVLRVLTGGCQISDNRTRILRNSTNEIIEVNNTIIDYPLLDGDQIELGKSVILEFKIN